VRNEYLKPDKKERIKRQFGHSHSEAEKIAQPPASIRPSSITQPPASIHPSTPSVSRAVIADTTPTPASPTLESGTASQTGATRSSSQSFRDIVNQHVHAVDEDDQDNESVRPHSSTWQETPLSSLFDFTSTHWKGQFEKWARLTYDEELAFYELLELDADGEVDPDFDDSIQDALPT
jgi:hypothetical protein